MDAPALLRDYPQGRAFDEAVDPSAVPRQTYREVMRWLEGYGPREFERRRQLIELVFRNQGITFTVYGDAAGTERSFPFDPVPRLIAAAEWSLLERGLRQRVLALNRFLADVYGEQSILADGVVPHRLVLGNPAYRPRMRGVRLPFGAYTHVVGTDLIRDEAGRFLVLEDNLRVPSGVSYMLANRAVMARSFPRMMEATPVRTVRHYPLALLECLRSLSPRELLDPTVVVLTPGPFNSAYFEHAYLAQQMGVELVEGRDLFVDEGRVWMRTTDGPQQVDVIYRRVDDNFLDPDAFRADSVLGVRGLVEAVAGGRVALANAIGTGVADDKAIYTYVPDMIRYYLDEEPLLPNVPTWRCADDGVLDQVERDVESLVIKEVAGAGGYGMLVGPESDAATRRAYLDGVRAHPERYIAQPVVTLSTHPTFDPATQRLVPRHVDLRPYVLVGEEITIVPGGLTRVALKPGSLVVNSSQGGGSKDTWVLDDDADALHGGDVTAGQGTA